MKVLVGILVAALIASPAAAQSARCRDGHGRFTRCSATVPAASNVPQGATARCRDGTYSYSRNHRGTCSRHGGVAAWL